MGEIDYQIALLLQHKFEQELKQPKECSSDLELARSLQDQFQKEYDTEKPTQDLVYKDKKVKNPTKSLTDPSWEVVDPTPDIHVLFMAFNERFFWSKLMAVCVSWSKRMTTCAGVCSYQGRGGLCSITLSEPLLKLRPRTDLVETLLHEMIHAYLFVTHNNRDRDGHGPEFHKHMYRINAEAGTNITVYHDFHDEVRLYQQHWWRCDGPCQKWKPYFGMVRRAMNRTPGPQDRWWSEHSRNCGGNFIKVKEPEKMQKKNSKSTKENKNPKEDIRKFISPVSSTKNSAAGNTTPNNIHTITNNSGNSKISTVIPSKANNIFGFTNLNGTKNTSKGISNPGEVKGAIRNSSSTMVINPKPSSSKNNISDQSKNQTRLNSTNKIENVLRNEAISNNSLDYSVIRNHWLNKFSNSSDSNSLKRKTSKDAGSTSLKIPKLSEDTSFSSDVTSNTTETHVKASSTSHLGNSLNQDTIYGQCPICGKRLLLEDINLHIDECLKTPDVEVNNECIICGKKVGQSQYENHVQLCSERFDEVFETPEAVTTKCNFCTKNVPIDTYSTHSATCLHSLDNVDETKYEIIDLTIQSREKKCGVCEKMIPKDIYDSHSENCLLKMYDAIENTYFSEKKSRQEKIDCLACGRMILKSELAIHLEDCMSLSRVFEDGNEPKEESSPIDLRKNCNGKTDKYNCPFCMKLVYEEQMQSHIDICLNSREKDVVLESFLNSGDF